MKLDSTNPDSTAGKSICFSKGNYMSEPSKTMGSEVRSYVSEGESWCYLFIHHQKVKSFTTQIEKDGKTFFVHKTIRYFRSKESHRVKSEEVPTVSGLLFFQENPLSVQKYLDERFPGYRLCKDCSTGKVARIPDAQMRPFMHITEMSPDRIRFLLRPFRYYAQNRTLLRITSGDLAGLEGYVIRIDRDRRLVMDVGGMSVSLSGIHAERFEVVAESADDGSVRGSEVCKRNLQERNAFIDGYFRPIHTPQEAELQAEKIEKLRLQTLSDLKENTIDTKEAYETLSFLIDEIGYHYSSSAGVPEECLSPVFRIGTRIMGDIDGILSLPSLPEGTRLRYEAERERLQTLYGAWIVE